MEKWSDLAVSILKTKVKKKTKQDLNSKDILSVTADTGLVRVSSSHCMEQ